MWKWKWIERCRWYSRKSYVVTKSIQSILNTTAGLHLPFFVKQTKKNMCHPFLSLSCLSSGLSSFPFCQPLPRNGTPAAQGVWSILMHHFWQKLGLPENCSLLLKINMRLLWMMPHSNPKDGCVYSLLDSLKTAIAKNSLYSRVHHWTASF